MRTTAVIIGAGHAGLAMSGRLTERSIDHVVLERGEVASSWRTQRWDSLRLLTPNWLTALPGLAAPDEDPDGYLPAHRFADLVVRYAGTIAAPVHTSTTVLAARAGGDGYEIVTDRGTWHAATVVIASGPASRAAVPEVALEVPADLAVHTPLTYRRPGDLAPGGVLVVGASASGVQLAEEIQRSGRPVTLSVGEHVRLPRTYRGRDVFWWLDAAGVLDEPHDRIDDLVRARHLPSPQLVGSPERRSLDLNALRALGIGIVGRLGRIRDGVAQFSGALANTCALADLKMNRLLDRFDDLARRAPLTVSAPERFEPTRLEAPALEIDLRRAGIATVLFATGFRPDYSWLDLPVLDRGGRIVHSGGVIDGAPGAYVLGLPVLRRRRSTYISGAAADTADLADELHRHLSRRRRLVR